MPHWIWPCCPLISRKFSLLLLYYDLILCTLLTDDLFTGFRKNWLKLLWILPQTAGNAAHLSCFAIRYVRKCINPFPVFIIASITVQVQKETICMNGFQQFWVHPDQFMKVEFSSWTSISLLSILSNPPRWGMQINIFKPNNHHCQRCFLIVCLVQHLLWWYM